GHEGPYLGQLEIVLHRFAPNVRAVHLMVDAPPFRPRSAGYLLAALARDAPAGSVYLCGVGDAPEAVMLRAGDYWFVGPDNGLLEPVAVQAADAAWWRVQWRPREMAASFLCRDVLAPVAARLALGMEAEAAGGAALERKPLGCPADLAEIVYIDRFGNAASGIRGSRMDKAAVLAGGGRKIARAETYNDADRGELFWYVNSDGLVEIAGNEVSAAAALDLAVGDPVTVEYS
ncbi:MAG TPA: SAM-dependent chlorinase/fluorinase, partial [Gammaproteobacteria bacterium]|nr:SAM-dependent chlorinase/fluorinase [Gammaproteobacteria bacterium]